MVKKQGKIVSDNGKPYLMQPDRQITIKADGSAEGTVAYECDKADVLFLPKARSAHPDEPSLVAHQIAITFMGLEKVRAVYSYIGLTAEYSEDNNSIEMDVSCDQVPIQTHPDFKDFAGTPEEPAEGAIWVDATTGEPTKKSKNAEFRGWSSGEFMGLETYLIPRPVVRKSYLRRSAPSMTEVGTIVDKIPGVTNPPGIKNWFCLGSSFVEVGGVFRCTEEFKGSPAPGWNKKVYKKR